MFSLALKLIKVRLKLSISLFIWEIHFYSKESIEGAHIVNSEFSCSDYTLLSCVFSLVVTLSFSENAYNDSSR